jgi:hypothetical protein
MSAKPPNFLAEFGSFLPVDVAATIAIYLL